MLRISCLFGLCLLAISCSKKLESVENTTEDGNIERYTRLVEDYGKDGQYTLTSPEGVKLEEAHYSKDTLDGQRILYYETGDTMQVENYAKGSFEGTYTEYFENGQVSTKGIYEQNTMKGKWTVYYESGQIKEIVTFENNEENGPFIEYYENGNLKAEGAYLGGDFEHGPLKLYNEEGTLIREMNCEQGICRTTWKAEGLDEEDSK